MRWLTQKSTWAGLGGIAAGAVLVSQGHVDTGVQAIVTGFSVIFLRQAIAKVGK
jgi:hypothetical protein